MKTRSFPLLFVAMALPLAAYAQIPSPAASATASVGVSGLAAPSGTPDTRSSMASPQSSPLASASGMPNDAEMMKQMIELSKLNENHKLLADVAGNWTYTVKMWMAPDAPPMESKGTATRKPMMNGRFYTLDVNGKMKMPGPDGKMQDFDFRGHGVEGYDNVKKKFVGTWMDNMGTGIMMSEGSYDPATKTFTYDGEVEMMPGMKQKVKEVVRVTDKNHHVFEWYEDREGQQVKTMEIAYTRAN